MFLRWTKYCDKSGKVRLYARLISARREGRRVRHLRVGSLYVRIHEGVEWSEEKRREIWDHLDYVLTRFDPSPAERENIERVFAAKVGERPDISPAAMALVRANKAAAEAIQRARARVTQCPDPN